ncbi:hypothetical protein HOA92_02055 [archaeon]|jgi:hypothetical protein|nr:hypothetical protein [archaeon]MBT6761797.1 hypothetical protein [archaeon]
MESKVKGFFFVTILVIVGLFVWSGMSGSLGDGAIAGNAVSLGISCNDSEATNERQVMTFGYNTDLDNGDVYEDECRTETKLTEYFCRGGDLSSQRVNCDKKGLVCEDGACVADVELPDLVYYDNSSLVDIVQVANVTYTRLSSGDLESVSVIGFEVYLEVVNEGDVTASGYTSNSIDLGSPLTDVSLFEFNGSMAIRTSADVYGHRDISWSMTSSKDLYFEHGSPGWSATAAMFEDLIAGNSVDLDMTYSLDVEDAIRESDVSNNVGTVTVVVDPSGWLFVEQ